MRRLLLTTSFLLLLAMQATGQYRFPSTGPNGEKPGLPPAPPPNPAKGRMDPPSHPTTTTSSGEVVSSVIGQVRVKDGSPLPGAITVSLQGRNWPEIKFETHLHTDGSYQFKKVPRPQRYLVRVHAEGYLEQQKDVVVAAGDTVVVNFTLPVPPPEGARKDFESGRALLEKEGDYAKSIESFQKAIVAYPKYSEAYLMMGMAYRAQDRLPEADTALKKAVELDDSPMSALISLGEVQNAEKDYASAEKTLLQALSLNPDSPQANMELARNYWDMGRWQDADPYAARALEVFADNPAAHLLMGNIQLRKRNAEGALQHFQEYLRLDPEGALAPQVRDLVGRLQKALAEQPR